MRIGDRLCDQAIWDGDRALWTGDERANLTGRWEVVHRSLGGDVYGGSAGIALFLTRLWSQTGDSRHRDTASGALAHAADWAERTRRGGTLYDGAAGVACVLAEAAAAFGDERLATLADRALATALQDAPTSNDLMGGRAGAIVALLYLARVLRHREAAEQAERLGRELLALALVTAQPGAAWASDGGGGEPPLCGLAHGASGIGLALALLGQRSADRAFLEHSAGAARYERAWLQRETGNWPDLRELTRARLAGGHRPPTPAYWCHGGPGIGLARMVQYAVSGDVVLAAEAGMALDLVERSLAELARAGAATDLSLCHGMASLVDVLLEAADRFGERELRALALECCELAAASARDDVWPCGVLEGGENPSLMLGLAGIGLMFLRAAIPACPGAGLLYVPGAMEARVIVQLRGVTGVDAVRDRAEALARLVPRSRVDRVSQRGRVLLHLERPDDVADATATLSALDDVEYAEPDVVDRHQGPGDEAAPPGGETD